MTRRSSPRLVMDRLRGARLESRAEQVGTFDLAVFDRAKEVMLDQVRLTVLDAGQLVGDVEAVSYLMAT